MKGDFSQWRPFEPGENFNGVLQQQGRVLLDTDWNDQTRITAHWQNQTGRDVIGTGVVAVPVNTPDGFKITAAQVKNTGGLKQVLLDVQPGHAWVDGLLVHLSGNIAMQREATYFAPPIQNPSLTADSIDNGVRDVVVLEVSREVVNGFQSPERLNEPALGGVDTTERIHTRFAFRLFRIAADEDCQNIRHKLQDDPATFGKLSVSLEPTNVVPGDCPVVDGGGYSGFEHQLYRIEIAEPGPAGPMFKWSQFNGGLVGTGDFVAASPNQVDIKGNFAAISTSNLNSFYLEALELNQTLGVWEITYGAMATLDQEKLTLGNTILGKLPSSGAPVFFRLWNDLVPIGKFTANQELRDGILLNFDLPGTKTYRPGDYWIFSVRAGEITNPTLLLQSAPPQGVRYHRAPVAELNWNSSLHLKTWNEIEDCRRRFRPLTIQRLCCTFIIGDGVTSFGDYNAVEEAALHLPPEGGELCFMPGTHYANLVLNSRHNVTIHGCGERTRVFPRKDQTANPIFRFIDCETIVVRDLDLMTLEGTAIEAAGSAWGQLADVKVEGCRVVAAKIGIAVWRGRNLRILNNVIKILDRAEGREGIVLQVDDGLVWRNVIGVVPAGERPPPPPNKPQPPDPTDPCADLPQIHSLKNWLIPYAKFLLGFKFLALPTSPYRALGGIHLLGGCEKVRIVENQIIGGAGNGVTLGGPVFSQAEDDSKVWTVANKTASRNVFLAYDEAKKPLGKIDLYIEGTHAWTDPGNYTEWISLNKGEHEIAVAPNYEITDVISGRIKDVAFYHILLLKPAPVSPPDERGFLYEIAIEQNDICRMGLSGVGFGLFEAVEKPVTKFWAKTVLFAAASTVRPLTFASLPLRLAASSNLVRELVIRENRLHHCWLNRVAGALEVESKYIGRGGISLGLCERTLVSSNHIYDNGTGALNPACGVFVAFGEDLEIRENTIYNNGAWQTGEERGTMKGGVRGGIYVWLASTISLASGSATNQRSALHVLENRVDQPAGHALRAVTFGSVNCSSNRFNCEHVGPGTLARIGGGVLLINLGGIQNRLYGGDDPFLVAKLQDRPVLFAQPTAINMAAAMATEPAAFFATSLAAPSPAVLDFPSGDTLFNNNQVRLGVNNESLVGQVIGSFDDVGYDGNQSWAFNRAGVVANAAIVAHTLRATDSRFRELGRGNPLSLFSYSATMNATAENQGDHCIIVGNANSTPDLLKDDNQELNNAQCRETRKRIEPAARLRWFIQTLIDAMSVKLASVLEADGKIGFSTAAHVGFADALSEVRQLVAVQRKQFQSEILRLRPLVGATHYRVQKYEARLQKNADIGRELAVQADLMRITPAETPAGATVMDGRVSDGGTSGIANLRVSLRSARDGQLKFSTKTDSTGYYSMPMAAEAVKSLRGQELLLQVEDPESKTVLAEPEPVVAMPGERLSHTIVVTMPTPDLAILDRLRLAKSRPPAEPGPKATTKVETRPSEPKTPPAAPETRPADAAAERREATKRKSIDKIRAKPRKPNK